jgi:hypothetical protein
MISLLIWAVVAQGGLITPQTSRPVLLSYNNQQYVSDYTFSFSLATPTRADSVLRILFPSSFDSGLGIGTCSAQDNSGKAVSCSVSDLTVDVECGELNAETKYQFTVLGITNPQSTGGTDHFRLETLTGINSLDFNDTFGRIGITKTAKVFSVASVTCTANCKAGQLGTYQFDFMTVQDVEKNSRIFLTFPSSLTLPSSLACSCTQLPALTCALSSKGILLATGISSAIALGTSITISLPNVQNPAFATTVGTFNIRIFEPIVNTMIDYALSLTGPTLTVNSISSVKVCPNSPGCTATDPYMALTNTMTFKVTATTTNPVALGGKFVVVFPTGFTLISDSCQVISGLKNSGFTEDEQLLCTVDPTAVSATVTNFKAFDAGTFSIKFKAVTPGAPGTYSPVVVTTYYDSTVQIDTDSSASITIVNMYPPNKWDFSWSNPPRVGNTETTTVLFRPHTDLDITAGDIPSYFIKFPSGFGVSGALTADYTPYHTFPVLSVTGTWTSGTLSFTDPGSPHPLVPSDNDNELVMFTGGATTFSFPTLPGTYEVEIVINNGASDVEAFIHDLVVLPEIMTGSVTAFSRDVNEKDLYKLQFKTTLDVPQGSIPELPSTPWGTVDVKFPTMNANMQPLWPLDLGTGKTTEETICCKSVLVLSPAAGDEMTCTIYPASASSPTDYVVVRVTNFEPIYKNVNVELHIADIVNAETASITPYVTIITYSVLGRFYQEYNTVTLNLPTKTYDDRSLVLPISNGRDPSGDGDNVITLLPDSVSSSTKLTLILWLEKSLASANSIIIKFPAAYPLPHKGVSCYFSYTTSASCLAYPDAGWIVILSTPFAMTDHIEYTLELYGLTNPIHKVPLSGLKFITIASYLELEYLQFQDFELTYGDVYPVSVTPSAYEAQAVDVTYDWIFTFTNSIAEGGYIILSFPKQDYVLGNDPVQTCRVEGMTPVSGTSVTCTFDSSTLKLSDFKDLSKGTKVTVKIYHVVNPANFGLTDYFAIESYSAAGYLQDANYDIEPLPITFKLPVGKLTHKAFYAEPSNGYSLANYYISILPSVTIPANSLILIEFPEGEFDDFPSVVDCKLSGGLSTLSSCTGDVNKVTVRTDTTYTKTDSSPLLNITISDVKNPTPGVTTGVVTISMSYAGIVTDESPEVEDNRKFTTDFEPGLIQFRSFDYDPFTSAEVGVFNFTVLVASPIKVGCSFNVRFSSGFPRNLAVNPLCYSPGLSNSTYPICTVSGRTVSVQVDQEWGTVAVPLNVSVYGIHLPNSGGTFKEFIMYSQCGAAMVDYAKVSVSDTLALLPSHMHITDLTTNSKYTGATAQVYITFNSFTSFTPGADDQVWIEFPTDYDLDVARDSGRCDSGLTVSTLLDPCTFTRQRAAIKAFSSTAVSTSSSMLMAVLGIENPFATGTTPYISAAIYESKTRKILSRTYDNLNRADPLTYEAGGTAVSINGGYSWSMNRGTRTAVMHFTFSVPASVDANVTATVPDGVRVVPNPVPIKAGALFSEFRVSVDINAELGSYVIKWTIDGTWTTPAYASFKRSTFTVTNNRDETITLEEPGYVPLGGSSLPLNVSLSSGVDKLMTVTLTQLSTVPTDTVYSPRTLTFAEGEQFKTYTINIPANSTGTYGEFLVSKDAIDAESYNIVKPLQTFSVSRSDGSSPQVYNYLLNSVSRHSASFLVTTEKTVKLYSALCLYGTRRPSLNETKQGYVDSPEDLYEQPRFLTFYDYTLSSSKYQYSFSIDALRAQTSYVLYIYVVDLSGNVAQKTLTIDFETNARHPSAIRTLQFTTDLNGTQSLLDESAKELGISRKRLDDYVPPGNSSSIVSNGTVFPSSSGLSRRLTGVTYQVILYTDPDDYSEVTPKSLLDKLTTLANFKTKFPTYDSSSSAATDLTGTEVSFSRTPKFGSALEGSLRLINLALTSDGYIYICVANTTEGAPKEIPWQVQAGVDSWNLPCRSSITVTASATPKEVELTGLDVNMRYTAYIGCGNLIPQYPDLSAEMISENFTTYGLATKDSADSGSSSSGTVAGIALAAVLFLY